MGAGIEPGHAATHQLDVQLALLKVAAVYVGDLELAARRRLDGRGDIAHLLVIEIQARHRIVRLRLRRLFFDAGRAAVRIEADHAVALGILHVIRKHGRTIVAHIGCLQAALKVMAVVQVVAEDQRRMMMADEFAADDEGLREAIRRRLHCVTNIDAPLMAIAEQLLEARRILRRRDQQDIAYAGQHQRGQRVIDHRLVVHRQQLLRHRHRGRVQPGAGAAGQDDAATLHESIHAHCPSRPS